VHPILSDGRRLGLYLLGWLSIGLLLTAGLNERTSWAATAAIFLPLSLVFAFISLNAGYLCRVFPIDVRTSVWRTALVHVVAAAIASGLWIGIGQLWVALIGLVAPDLQAGAIFSERRVLILVVGALLFWLASILHYLLIAFEASQQAERRAIESSLLTRDAELRALRAQIDPHFLFNSLHSISALTTIDPAAARRMCLLLAEFLRETLRLGSNNRISLADEFALADRFLEIERVRLGPRLQVSRETDASATACLVPPLLIQPLVENAVVHGVAQLVEGGLIRIAASRGGPTLTIAIENPCDPDRPRRRRSGFGLELLRKRVVTQFGADGSVLVEEHEGRFRVEVRIPAEDAA
jgi:two-component system, LytTR family, sensor histidine kinase AlgZ